MGFDLQTLRFVFDAKRAGADFTRTVTLGRQNLHISKRVLHREAKRFGLDAIANKVDEVFEGYPYVDNLLQLLGASAPASIDASHYEGATHIFDFNHPIPNSLDGLFSLVIDGGTLEHIFNFPQAVRNIAQILGNDGTFLSVNGANNFMGHGLYQFSPELFFRVFCKENGFSVNSMVLSEVNDDAIWYDVEDPAVIRGRVQLVNNARTYLLMRAQKKLTTEMFSNSPQQSDYHDETWINPEAIANQSFLKRPVHQRLVEICFPRPARTALRRMRQATRNHFAANAYRPRRL